MIDAILIPADQSEPLKLIEVDATDYKQYQSLVGGLVDLVRLDHSTAGLWFCDEGAYHGYDPNPRATLLGNVGCVELRYAVNLVGDCVLVGGADKHGNDLSVPKHYRRMLTAKKFHIRSQVGESSWFDHTALYDDMWQAYAAAYESARTFADVKIMIVPSGYQE